MPISMGPVPCSTRLGELGVDLDDVGRVLEEEGVSAFVKSFDEVLTTLGDSADELRALTSVAAGVGCKSQLTHLACAGGRIASYRTAITMTSSARSPRRCS